MMSTRTGGLGTAIRGRHYRKFCRYGSTSLRIDHRYVQRPGYLQIIFSERKVNLVITHKVGLNLTGVNPNHRDFAQSFASDRDLLRFFASRNFTRIEAADRRRIELVTARVARLE